MKRAGSDNYKRKGLMDEWFEGSSNSSKRTVCKPRFSETMQDGRILIDLESIDEKDTIVSVQTIKIEKEDNDVPLESKYTSIYQFLMPREFSEFVGHTESMGPDCLFMDLIKSDKLQSTIIWGSSGTGKTSLVALIAKSTKHNVIETSAVSCSLDALKNHVKEARRLLFNSKYKRKTIIIVEEIHRFNKLQQDFFLPLIEKNEIILIGCTTENPSFSLNPPLVSRCHLLMLTPHNSFEIVELLTKSISKINTLENNKYWYDYRISANKNVLSAISHVVDGDARCAIKILDMCIMRAIFQCKRNNTHANSIVDVDMDTVKSTLQRTNASFDEDDKYTLISALHKSLRGSDVNAGFYYTARLLANNSNSEAMYVMRRLLRFASEDIGQADHNALIFATSALEAVKSLGLPESKVVIYQTVAYLANASKSVAIYKAGKLADAYVATNPQHQVPLHLINAPTKLMENIGFGKHYLYNPDHSQTELFHQTYLPPEIIDINFFDTKYSNKDSKE